MMDTPQKAHGHSRQGGLALAAILILAGIILFARQLGYINDNVYHVIKSWQMLLIVLGGLSLIGKRYYNGIVLIGIGLFFMIPKFIGAGYEWPGTYWPLLLIMAGVLIIVKMRKPAPDRQTHLGRHFSKNASYNTEDSFVVSNNVFGSVRQIVLDPVFKGADIRNTFGGTILDLRHTKLEDAETYIDVDCLFGGVEIYVPSRWLVITKVQPILGGSEDKRFREGETETDHKLVIRGRVTFGGVEIKN